MSAVLVATGASIYLLLGLAHAAFTLQSKPDGGPMMPTNLDTLAAMHVRGGLGLEPALDNTLYQAWIGFNLSHSLGIVAIAAVVLVHSVTDLAAVVTEPWFLVLVAVVPCAYLVLAIKYWFAKPRDAIAFASLLVWAGVALELL